MFSKCRHPNLSGSQSVTDRCLVWYFQQVSKTCLINKFNSKFFLWKTKYFLIVFSLQWSHLVFTTLINWTTVYSLTEFTLLRFNNTSFYTASKCSFNDLELFFICCHFPSISKWQRFKWSILLSHFQYKISIDHLGKINT